MFNFYYCDDCQEVVILPTTKSVCVCADKAMKLLVANTVDAATEKHVPHVIRNGNVLEVQVGSTLHPMDADHYITMVAVVQGDKVQMVKLVPGVAPKASFVVSDGSVTVFEFCNKHGLWSAEA